MLVVCFHQKIPTGLNFTTFAPGLLSVHNISNNITTISTGICESHAS